MSISFRVNGSPHVVEAPPDEPLLRTLRDRLGLTGTKYGCGESQCGACTVLLDGAPIHSCVTPVSVAARREVTTIEGLTPAGSSRGGDDSSDEDDAGEDNAGRSQRLAATARLHPVQQAFLDEEAFQCGYCTPGMIMRAVGFLRRSPDPDERAIVEGMNPNVCRCGTYPRIVAAVRRAAQMQRKA
jgi:nicotinate dehydrogenase subunit A